MSAGELIMTTGVVLVFLTFMSMCAAIAGAPENEDCDDEIENA